MTVLLGILAIVYNRRKQRKNFVRLILSHSPYCSELSHIERTVNEGIDVYCTIVNVNALRSVNAWMLENV